MKRAPLRRCFFVVARLARTLSLPPQSLELTVARPDLRGRTLNETRPDDPEKNTRPRGNGDQDERDTEKGRDKLDSVLGQ